LLALDDETAARVFLQEAGYIGQGQSFDIPVDEVIEETVKTPNPLGGDPIDFAVSYRLVRDSPESIEIESIGVSDPQSMRESLAKSVEQMARQFGRPIERMREQMADWTIERRDRVTYVIGKEDGWIRNVKLERRSALSLGNETRERLDAWTIDVLKK
jgi:hypothetical protein